MKLFALLEFRDEADELPGYLANVAPQVDGIVALDHGSIDGSAELIRREPKLVQLLSRPRSSPRHAGMHHRILTEAGVSLGADWLIGIDADERLERSFARKVRARIAEDQLGEHDAYALPICELWDRRDTFRVDGIWGRKARTTLFRSSEDHRLVDKPLHAQWGASVSELPLDEHPQIDVRIYHLGMLTREDRAARQARFRRLDPDNRWQPIGYDYLTDESGLRLQRIEGGREYEEAIVTGGAATR